MVALDWIGYVVEWIGRFVPRWILLDTTQGGIKFTHHWKRNGWTLEKYYTVKPLGPGGHWYWPWHSRVTVTIVVRDTLDLEGQSITLKDGEVIMVGATVRKEIVDVEKALAYASDIDNCIRDEVMSAIPEVLIQYTWKEFQEMIGSKEFGKQLKAAAQKPLTQYGVKILNVGLRDFAPTFVLKLVTEND